MKRWDEVLIDLAGQLTVVEKRRWDSCNTGCAVPRRKIHIGSPESKLVNRQAPANRHKWTRSVQS